MLSVKTSLRSISSHLGPVRSRVRVLSKISRRGEEVENRRGSQFFEPFKREGIWKKWQEKKEGHKKINHHDREGMLQYFVLREYKPYMNIQLFPDIQFNLH